MVRCAARHSSHRLLEQGFTAFETCSRNRPDRPPVSTMKKSTAMMLFAWARRNSRHDGPAPSPLDRVAPAENILDRARGHDDAEALRSPTCADSPSANSRALTA